ncbi:MAG TPA: DUF3857 domain-containing protein [Prosthecobacter sp.]|nr:DUF3857 domain-containing protein [Prosthecobacter sp.]
MILLDENIIYTDEKGSRVLVHHRVEEAFTESGANSLAEDTHSYRTADQSIHLVEARTILPDGRSLPVEDSAAFLESPQTDAADSVYGDRGQLRVIFSGIKPGVVRQMIVVVVEDTPRVPGHFSTQELWGAFWPERTTRTVVLFPDSIANRVKTTRLGSGVPEAVKEEWRSGWKKWTWLKEKTPSARYEGGRPPSNQVGPAVMLTTLPDWEAFGDWYRDLLEPRAVLPPALKKLVVEWTKDAKTPAEKLESIITHVSRDLRYTGLEFGLGAFQPRTAEEIWKTGYGDCKDKSNLAVLLLREVGIEANLVLLQTEHAGRVEKRAPDYRHFNHAILAAEIGGERIFSDPTIRYGKPGLLAASSSDRDVLIIKKDAVEWARTPAFAEAQAHYKVDAALSADGTLEGWLELASTGYFDSSYRAYYERLGPEELRRDLQEMLTNILPGARLIDAEHAKTGGLTWRCFFSLPNQSDEGEDRHTLHFPAGDAVMLGVEEEETRETARFLWPITWRVSGKISLPEGWQAAEVPPAFDLHTEPYEVRASWTVKDGVCQPDYEAHVTRSLLPPADHPSVWRGTQALRTWLRKPLRLARGASAPPAGDAPATLAKFPLMPTGKGQLELVEQRYPETGNRAMRRAALKKTIDYFPDDPATLFNARARLALLDWDENKPDEALRALRDLTNNPSSKVPDEIVWWARYMIGLVLADTKKFDEALKEFEPIIKHTSLSAYRRSWACFQAGYVLDKLEKRELALARAREGLALEEVSTAPELLGLCASLLFHLEKQTELKDAVTSVLKAHGADAEPALKRLAEVAVLWSKDGHAAWTRELATLLESLPPEALTAEVTATVEQAREAIAVVSVAVDLQKELRDFLAAKPELAVLKAPVDGWPQSQELTETAYAKADKEGDSDLASRLALHSLMAFPADSQFAARLWKAAAHLEHHERTQKPPAISPLLGKLFELAKRLPKSDDNYFEMRFLEARAIETRYQDWKRAAALYEEVTADKAMPQSFLPSGITRLANCYQALEDWPQTVAALSKLEAVKNYTSAGDGLARAAHLRLEMGKPDEALRLLRLVESGRDFALKNSEMAEILAEFLDTAKDEKVAKARWQRPTWWAEWRALEKLLGVRNKEVEPMIVDLQAVGGAIGQAVRDKDAGAAGQTARLVAHSARWLPGRVIDMAWVCTFQLPSLHPEQHQSLLAFVQALLDDFEPATDDQRRARLMYLSLSHMDRDHSERALHHLHAYFKAYPKDEHPITFAMARLWGSAALDTKAEQPAAIAALERTLDSKELRTERTRSVRILADLYRISGKAEKETQLLMASLTHPAIASDPQQVSYLKQRLEQLTAGASYAQSVKRWLSTHAPGWYEYAKPKDLKSLGEEEDLVAKIQDTYDEREVAENIKVYFLAASDESLPVEKIEDCWARGLSLLFRLQVVEESQMRRALDGALDDPKMPLPLKETMVRIAYLHLGNLEEKALLKYLRGKLNPSQLSPFSRDRMALVDTVLAVDLENPQAAVDAVKVQVKKRDEGALEFLVSILGDRAVRYGKLAVLEAISDALAQARKEGSIESASLQSMRLEVIRARTGVRRLAPVHNALAEVVLNHPIAQPAKDFQLPHLIGTISYPLLPSRKYMDWVHDQVRRGSRPSDDLGLWFGYLDACTEVSTTTTWDLRRALVDAAIKSAADDETRAEVVGLATSAVDIDSEMERAHLLKALKPWRDSAAQPRAFAEIRLLEAQIAQRLGMDFDLQSLSQLKAGKVEDRLSQLRLDAALQSADATVVGTALDELGSDALLEGDIPEIIRALKICGRKDELELALETAEEKLYHAVLMSWTGISHRSVRNALALAEALENPDALPEAWLTFVHEAYPERHDQLMVAMRVARLKKDWPGVLAAASEAVDKFPTFYSTYWNKAQALWELERKAEALEPLRVYLKYCHNEAEYRQAQALLKKETEE